MLVVVVFVWPGDTQALRLMRAVTAAMIARLLKCLRRRMRHASREPTRILPPPSGHRNDAVWDAAMVHCRARGGCSWRHSGRGKCARRSRRQALATECHSSIESIQSSESYNVGTLIVRDGECAGGGGDLKVGVSQGEGCRGTSVGSCRSDVIGAGSSIGSRAHGRYAGRIGRGGCSRQRCACSACRGCICHSYSRKRIAVLVDDERAQSSGKCRTDDRALSVPGAHLWCGDAASCVKVQVLRLRSYLSARINGQGDNACGAAACDGEREWQAGERNRRIGFTAIQTVVDRCEVCALRARGGTEVALKQFEAGAVVSVTAG